MGPTCSELPREVRGKQTPEKFLFLECTGENIPEGEAGPSLRSTEAPRAGCGGPGTEPGRRGDQPRRARARRARQRGGPGRAGRQRARREALPGEPVERVPAPGPQRRAGLSPGPAAPRLHPPGAAGAGGRAEGRGGSRPRRR